MEDSLLKKAVSSNNLIKRAEANRLYSKNDFNLWVSSLLEKLNFSSVLDVCCGTGNQMILYAQRPTLKYMVGVDISQTALDNARERLQKINSKVNIKFKAIKMEEMFEDPELRQNRFDIISCFYGLYYSQDVEGTLNRMIDHLSDTGALIIVGPYGKNNALLFELLQRHFRLPDLVLRSSTSFMEEEVYPILYKRCVIEEKRFVNQVYYPTPCSLIDYWKASTFYSPENEDKVIGDIQTHFCKNKEFIVEKHVLAYITRRRR